MLKKIKSLSKDFSLIDLGCGTAGVLKGIKKEFNYSNLYGVDVLPDLFSLKPNDLHGI